MYKNIDNMKTVMTELYVVNSMHYWWLIYGTNPNNAQTCPLDIYIKFTLNILHVPVCMGLSQGNWSEVAHHKTKLFTLVHNWCRY